MVWRVYIMKVRYVHISMNCYISDSNSTRWLPLTSILGHEIMKNLIFLFENMTLRPSNVTLKSTQHLQPPCRRLCAFCCLLFPCVRVCVYNASTQLNVYSHLPMMYSVYYKDKNNILVKLATQVLSKRVTYSPESYCVFVINVWKCIEGSNIWLFRLNLSFQSISHQTNKICILKVFCCHLFWHSRFCRKNSLRT